MTKSPAKPSVTHAMEDYLKAVYRLQESSEQVTTQRLAEALSVTPASVTNMVKRLSELRLVAYEPYKGVTLTDSGRKVALEIVRHHRLLELYLAETLGMPWDEVHAEAERLEHHLSDELEARMDERLGFPTRDPHGDPIPSAELAIAAEMSVPLLSLEVGQRATVVRVSDRDPAQLRYLGSLGLTPGSRVEVLERHPFGGPMRLLIDGSTEAPVIGAPLASAVEVVPDGG